MFEWDARKAAVNRTKHGISFEERGCAVSRALRGLGFVLMVIAALSGPRTVAGVWAQPPATPDRSPSDTIREDIEHIARLFYDKQCEAVVRDA